MPITEPEWLSVRGMIERMIKNIVGSRADYFVTGKVLKVDEHNKCIFMKEFGDQPIPIVAFDYDVKYYDVSDAGTAIKHVTTTVIMPKRGQTVLVAREMGLRRMPRCLGVIQGKNWIIPEAE